jgi:hypothetical protein
VSNIKGHAQLANTLTTIVNISRTGVLVSAPKEWLPGARLPLTIDLDGGALTVTGTVVRSEVASPFVVDGTPRRQFAVALSFVSPSHDAQRVLDAMCGPQRQRHGLRIGPVHLSGARYCPRCFSRSVVRGSRRRYSCDNCHHEFVGFRIGFVRLAF